MEPVKSFENYLLLKEWWDAIVLTNFEKSLFNKQIMSFNQQLFRLKEKKIRIGIYGKSGVGKSSILNSLLNKKAFKTNVINGSTKQIEYEEWFLQNHSLKAIELIDSPGFDYCNNSNADEIEDHINNTDLILFTVAGDLNRNELNKINSFIENGKKIIIILNKIDIWNKHELIEIQENINLKLPKKLNIPIVINSGNNIKNYLIKTIRAYGEILLILNSLQSADQLFLKLKLQRLKKRKHQAQSIIGKFATIKASGVALNPLFLIDIAGSFAIDTALISELGKLYGLNPTAESARKIFKKISLNNLFLGVTQVGINTSFNILRKMILLTAPLTHGLTLVPYGPIALIQAVIAIHSTKIIGKLAAKEIFTKDNICRIEPFLIIQNIILKEPKIFNHINIYLAKRNLNNNFAVFLP